MCATSASHRINQSPPPLAWGFGSPFAAGLFLLLRFAGGFLVRMRHNTSDAGYSMSVTHINPVSNFEECLRVGGKHAFDITVDEMPALKALVRTGATVLIPFDEAHNVPLDGIWSRIARMLSDKGATFHYSQINADIYRVLCTVPGADAAGPATNLF